MAIPNGAPVESITLTKVLSPRAKYDKAVRGFSGFEGNSGLLVGMGVSEAQQERVGNFLKRANAQDLSVLRDKVVTRLYDSGIDAENDIPAVNRRASEYMKAAGTLLRSNCPDEVVETVKKSLKEGDTDLAVLSSCVLLPGDASAETRGRLWRVMLSSVYESARAQGIALPSAEDEMQLSTIVSQRYPTVTSPDGDKRLPLTRLVAEEIESLGDNYFDLQSKEFILRPVSELHEGLRSYVEERVKPFDDLLQQTKPEIDIPKIVKQSSDYTGRSLPQIELSADQLNTLMVHLFHPTKGEFYQMEQVQAMETLNALIFRLKGVSEVPDALKLMLTYAVFSPDRGVMQAARIGNNMDSLYDSLGFRQLFYEYNNLPQDMKDTLMPLREAVIGTRLSEEIHRDVIAERANIDAKEKEEFGASLWLEKSRLTDSSVRSNISELLSWAYGSDMTDEFYVFLLKQCDEITPDKQKPYGGIDVFKYMLGVRGKNKYYSGSLNWENPDGTDIIDLGSEIWLSKLKGILAGSESRTSAFFNKAEAVYDAFTDPEPKAAVLRVLTGLPGSNYDGVVSYERKIALMQMFLRFPKGVTVDSYFFASEGPELWFKPGECDRYEWIEHVKDPSTKDSSRRSVRHDAVQKDLDRILSVHSERQKIADELLTGVDKRQILDMQMRRLRADEEYLLWEQRVREQVNEKLDEIGKIPEPRLFEFSYVTDMEGVSNYQDWVVLGAQRALFPNRKTPSYYNEKQLTVNSDFTVHSDLSRNGEKLRVSDVHTAREHISEHYDYDIVRGLLLRSSYSSRSADSTDRDVYVFPPAGGTNNTAIVNALERMKPTEAQAVLGTLATFEKSFVDLEKLAYFKEIFDFPKLRTELQAVVEMYKDLSQENVKDRKNSVYAYESMRMAPRELNDLMDHMIYLIGSTYRAKELGVTVSTSDDSFEVEGAVGLRLAQTFGMFDGKAKMDDPRIVPVSARVKKGSVIAVTGPTGAGKSTYMEAIRDGLVMADEGTPMAKKVTTIDYGKLGTRIIRSEGFQSVMMTGKSTFQASATQMAEAQAARITFMDEPGVGSPTDLRVRLVDANVLEKIHRGGEVIIGTHQGTDMATMFSILGLDDKLETIYVTPDDKHEVHAGIGGSFGLRMLLQRGCSERFVNLAQLFADAGEAGMSKGSLVVDQEISSPKEGVFADLTTLDSAQIFDSNRDDNVLMYFVHRAGIRERAVDTTLKRMHRQFQKSLNGDAAQTIEMIGKFEDMKLDEHIRFTENIIWADGILKQIRGVDSLDGIHELYESPQKLEEHILNLVDGKRVLLFQNESQLQRLMNVVNQLPEASRTRAGELVTTLTKAASEMEPNKIDTEAFLRAFDKPVQNLDSILYNIKNIVRYREDTYHFDAKIKERLTEISRDVAEANLPVVVQFLVDFMQEYPSVLTEYDVRDHRPQLNTAIGAGKRVFVEKLYEPIIDSTETTATFASTFNELVATMEGEMDPMTFASVYGYSTRTDNQDVPFCKPDIVENVESMPFPQQLHEAWNLSCARALAIKNEKEKVGWGKPVTIPKDLKDTGYIPQDLFTKGDGTAMSLEDMPLADGVSRSPIHVLEYTGLQGGGKTETVRAQLQMELLRKATGRVSAKFARMAPTPSRVIGMLQSSQSKGATSSFMMEADHLAQIEAQLANGAMVFVDEPGKMTVQEETCAITDALGYTIDQMGGHMIFTNHEAGVRTGWDRLESQNKVKWYPLGYEYTEDPGQKFRVQHGKVGGAETYKVAQEMGVKLETVELAQLLYEVHDEFLQHKKRILS